MIFSADISYRKVTRVNAKNTAEKTAAGIGDKLCAVYCMHSK